MESLTPVEGMLQPSDNGLFRQHTVVTACSYCIQRVLRRFVEADSRHCIHATGLTELQECTEERDKQGTTTSPSSSGHRANLQWIVVAISTMRHK